MTHPTKIGSPSASDGHPLGVDVREEGASGAVAVKLPDRFINATCLSELDRVLDANAMDKLRRRYDEYSRVVFAMGVFFFCTGLQWSIFIGNTTSYEEMRKICHHNERCNLATPENINWMGLNPDMTWSNAVYFVTAVFICGAATYHRSRGFRFMYGRSESKITPALGTDETAEEQDKAPHAVLLHGASMVMQCAVGRSHTTVGTKGLANSHLSGMYWFCGTAIFVEGALSALYHTCPSKTFQQFDYIGITTCEISIFIMLWSKCHPVLPTAGTMAVYMSMLGLMAAAETPLPLKSKPIMWCIFGVWILVVIPFVATTLNYGLESIARPGELLSCAKNLYYRGIVFQKRALLHLIPIILLFYVYMAVNLDSLGWWHTCIVLLIYIGCMVVFGVFLWVVARPDQEDEECFAKMAEERNVPAKILEKERNWQVVRIAVLFLWISCGVDHVVQGASFPLKHNMSHAIMQWHGKGAALYYVQFYVGLFYFEVFNWSTFKSPKFIRAVVLFVLMLLCGVLGGDYFVNGTYKANAQITRWGISCDNNGEADSSLCAMSANSSLDADYPCGLRDGNYTCLVGSLDYNDGCSFIPGMDGHSLWHVFSAIALFLLPVSFLVVDDLLADVERTDIPVL